MKKLLAVFALVLGFTSVSQAGLLLEPYIGYEMGTAKSDSGGDGKTEAVNVGGRIAYTLPVMFWLGVDANVGTSGKYKPDTGTDVDTKRTSLSAVVGMDFPILLRAWLAYGFVNEIKFDDAFDSKVKGSNVKVGVGFTGLPFVSLNVEYIKDDFKDVDTNLGSGTTDLKHDSVMLSVSLPFEI
ncbi:outer membrane beta-barrel protein [Bdellovibrio sp.]|uniref:outer membrane beta-barrel protein n=1 Tax=Bdellovibrio sp. TaxID=28201 RepID=UPI0039E550BD